MTYSDHREDSWLPPLLYLYIYDGCDLPSFAASTLWIMFEAAPDMVFFFLWIWYLPLSSTVRQRKLLFNFFGDLFLGYFYLLFLATTPRLLSDPPLDPARSDIILWFRRLVLVCFDLFIFFFTVYSASLMASFFLSLLYWFRSHPVWDRILLSTTSTTYGGWLRVRLFFMPSWWGGQTVWRVVSFGVHNYRLGHVFLNDSTTEREKALLGRLLSTVFFLTWFFDFSFLCLFYISPLLSLCSLFPWIISFSLSWLLVSFIFSPDASAWPCSCK